MPIYEDADSGGYSWTDSDQLKNLEAEDRQLFNNRNGKRRKRCSYCGSSDHTRPTCPHKPADDVKPSTSGAQPRYASPEYAEELRTQERNRRHRQERDRPPERAGAGVGGSELAQLDDVETQATVLLRMLGEAWSIKDPYCGPVLVEHAPIMAKSYVDWGRQNPRVAKALLAMSHGSGLIGVIAAHMPLALAILAHHGPAARPQGAQARQAQWRAEVNLAAQQAGVPVSEILAQIAQAEGRDIDELWQQFNAEPQAA